MQRLPIKFFFISQFYEAAQVHYSDSITYVLHDAEIMRNKKVGQAKAFTKLQQQVDNLGLDRDVQGTHRLVGQDELWL